MQRRSGKSKPCLGVARKLINSGIKTAIITMASQGCMAVQGDEIIRAYAPKVKAVDASGAGATFSSGYVYGYLNGWNLEDTVRFAIAAASLKVTRSGLEMFPCKKIHGTGAHVRIERMVYRGDQFHTIRKFLTLPKDSPFVNNALLKKARNWRQRFCRRKKWNEKRSKDRWSNNLSNKDVKPCHLPLYLLRNRLNEFMMPHWKF
jgi:hypothetical protein